jgi:YesN/AraC family two-component response regulator
LKGEETNQTSILIVDDECGVRTELTYLLEEEGFRVQEAPDGVKAKTYLEERPYNIIITDLLMPDMDGMELIDYIKTAHPSSKIIAISGGGDFFDEGDDTKKYLQSSKKYGADHILNKPFEYPDLLEIVKAIVQSKKVK